MTEHDDMPSVRPLPAPDDVSRFHWDAAAQHRLVLQKCAGCATLQYPPEVCCLCCQGQDFELVESAGDGVIYSYSVVDRPLHAGFVDLVPYVVVIVDLDDQPGLRMLTNLVDTTPDTPLSCGMAVEVAFEDVGAVTLPQFRLRQVAS